MAEILVARPTSDLMKSSLTSSTCIQGESGEAAERGFPGLPGPKGELGERGIRGEKGEKGDMGLPGIFHHFHRPFPAIDDGGHLAATGPNSLMSTGGIDSFGMADLTWPATRVQLDGRPVNPAPI